MELNYRITRKPYKIIKFLLALSTIIIALQAWMFLSQPKYVDQYNYQQVSWEEVMSVFPTSVKSNAIVDIIRNLPTSINTKSIELLKHSLSSLHNNDLSRLLHKFMIFKKTQQDIKHYPDSSRREPITYLSPSLSINYTDTWHGYELPVITITSNGRLGNNMGEYATLYALSKIFNATILVQENRKKNLLKHFPNLSLRSIRRESNEPWITLSNDSPYGYISMELATAGLLGAKQFSFVGYPFEFQLFNAYREDLFKEFQFNPQIGQKAEDFLASVHRMKNSSGFSTSVTVVGVHIRLTDYASHMKKMFGIKNLSYKMYLKNSFSYFKNNFKDVIFIVASDNPKKAKEILSEIDDDEIIYSEGATPTEDMAIMSKCNHSITTLGTFGFWGAFLSEGVTTYPDLTHLNISYPLTTMLAKYAEVVNFIPIPIK